MAVSPRTRFRILERDHFTCQYCGRSAPEVVLEVDHYEAKALGGGDHDWNLVTACRDCNSGKSNTEMWVSNESRIRVGYFMGRMAREDGL
jgi:5-methylcytosine-specific restriction endonuclease McrA